MDLRGGARAMSAPATGGGGGGKSSSGRDKRTKAGGAAGKEGDEGRGGGGGGESRGKNIPLAGRPLFTSVASTKVRRALLLLLLAVGKKRPADMPRLSW